jgi:hypothetical protein
MKKVLFGLVLAAVALPLLAQQKPVYHLRLYQGFFLLRQN